MRLIKAFREKIINRQAERFTLELLTYKIQLKDIPLWLLRDYRYCYTLYITAFRVDRNMSKAQYESDFCFLEAEIILASTAKNMVLVETLKDVKAHVYWWLETS